MKVFGVLMIGYGIFSALYFARVIAAEEGAEVNWHGIGQGLICIALGMGLIGKSDASAKT